MAPKACIRAGVFVAVLAFATACADDGQSPASDDESPSARASSASTDESRTTTASPSEKGGAWLCRPTAGFSGLLGVSHFPVERGLGRSAPS